MNDVTPVRETALPAADTASPFAWLRSEIDRLFDDFGRPARGMLGLGDRALMPALEMVESDTAYTLTAELPGMDDKDIELTVEDGMLHLSGRKREDSERKDKGFLLAERRYGAFDRRVSLPTDVDPDGVRARYADGVLTVTLPKDEKAAPRARRIEIA